MLYTCSHGLNGHQQASDECASATALNAGTRRGWDSSGYFERTARAGTGPPAGGTGETVRAQSGPRSGGPAAIGDRGTGCFVPSSWHRGRRVVPGGHRGSVPDSNHSRDHRVEALRPENDRLGFSQGGGRARSDRRRSQCCAFRRAELGIPRESVCPRTPTEDAQYHQNAPQSRVAISPRRLRRIGLQERVSRGTPADPRSVPTSGRRRCGGGLESAFVGVGQEHSRICSPSEEWGARRVPTYKITQQFPRSSVRLSELVVTFSSGASFLFSIAAGPSAGFPSVLHPRRSRTAALKPANTVVAALWRCLGSGSKLSLLPLCFSHSSTKAHPHRFSTTKAGTL